MKLVIESHLGIALTKTDTPDGKSHVYSVNALGIPIEDKCFPAHAEKEARDYYQLCLTKLASIKP